MYRESLAISLDAYGDEHPETAFTLGNLASAILQQGELEEAEQLYRKALKIRREKLSANSPLVATSLLGLGQVLVGKNKPADAEPLLRDALAITTNARPKGHWRMGVCQSVLGECLTALEMFEEAEHLLLRGHDVLVSSKGESSLQTIAARNRIVVLYTKWEKPKKANSWSEASQAVPSEDSIRVKLGPP